MEDLVRVLQGIHSNITSKRPLSPKTRIDTSSGQNTEQSKSQGQIGEQPTLLGQLSDDREKERYAYELCSKILSKG